MNMNINKKGAVLKERHVAGFLSYCEWKKF